MFQLHVFGDVIFLTVSGEHLSASERSLGSIFTVCFLFVFVFYFGTNSGAWLGLNTVLLCLNQVTAEAPGRAAQLAARGEQCRWGL